MKNLKKVLALVLAVVMIMGTVAVASAKDFKDVKATDNYAKAIDVLSNLGIIDGFTDGEYKPEGYFTRAQAAKMVAIVHNAATNGKIKGQDGISALYGNAQNAFTDCTGNWAVAYINYCRATGLLDGITRTTYAPNSKLTGVQWLKLMLTTLGFDTSKEGYLGAGWDVNVLNRANEIKLLDGLADGWKGNVPVTRGEAAQILYNALTAFLVEYGQNIKQYDPSVTAGRFLTNAFVANETVEATGLTLAKKMGVGLARTTDAFRRPGYTWSYGAWSKFYMDTPKAEYKTYATMCDILKVMGVAENSGSSVKLNGWYKGIVKDEDHPKATTEASVLKVDGKKVPLTALNYYAVDGYKYGAITLNHDTAKKCQLITDDQNGLGWGWSSNLFGGQGDLTQVFATEDGWVITTIHTFLGEIDSFDGVNKYDHAKKATATVKIWLNGQDEPNYEQNVWLKTGYAIDTTAYALGTKVLTQLTMKKSEVENLATYKKATASIVAAPEAKTGKLTGASGINQAETVSIDGTKYPAACRFVLGQDDAMNIVNNGKVFTFYFDTYGNVIGRVANTDTKSYVVMDEIWSHADNGKFTVYAKLYDLTGAVVGDGMVKVSTKAGSFNGFSAKVAEYGNKGDYFANKIATLSDYNDPQLTDALYTYTVDEDGLYVLEVAGKRTYDGVNEAIGAGYGRYGGYDGGYLTHKAKTAYLALDVEEDDDVYLNLTEATKFVVKHGTKWESYTGYTALPAMSAKYVDYTLDTDGFASIVYIGEAVYDGDNFTGFVPTWKSFNWVNVNGIAYAQVNVYVDGELKTVNVLPEAHFWNSEEWYSLRNDNEPAPGLYKFFTNIDDKGNTYVYFAGEDTYLLAQGIAEVADTSKDVTAFTVKGNNAAFNVTGATIYLVKADGTMETVDSSYIPGAYVMVYGDADHIFNSYYAVTIYAFATNAPHPAEH